MFYDVQDSWGGRVLAVYMMGGLTELLSHLARKDFENSGTKQSEKCLALAQDFNENGMNYS